MPKLSKEAIAKIERSRKLNLLEKHMKALIKSKVNDSVVLEPGHEKWDFQPEKNTIVYATSGDKNIMNMTEWEIMSTLYHEIAHAKYTEGLDFYTITLPEPKREYGTFLNTVEDIRIERRLTQQFPGIDDNFQTIAEKQQALIDEELLAKTPPHLNVLLNLRQKERGFDFKFSSDKSKEVFHLLEDKFEEAYTKKSTTELHEFLSTRVWDEFQKLLEPPEPPEPPKEDEKEENKEDDKPEDEEQKDEEEKGENPDDENESREGAGGQGQDSKTDDTENAEEGSQESTEQNVQFGNDMTKAQDMVEIVDALIKNSGKEAQKEESLLEKIDREEKVSSEQIDAKPLLKIEYLDELKSAVDFRTYEELFEDIKPYYNYFKQKLGSVMEDNRLSRAGGTYLSGNLNNNILYKWKCKDYRVFSRPVLRQNKEYAITLLVDESGSMLRGEKNVNAARATVLLAEVLNKCRIPFEIRGFNDTNRLYKSFGTPFNWAVKRTLENIIPSARSINCGNTNDAHALNFAMSNLRKQKGKKIIIVISDGISSPSYRALTYAEKKDLIGKYKKNERASDFDLDDEIRYAKRDAIVIGLGIGAPEVKDSYPQHAVCDEVSELPRVLLNILRKLIRRG